MGSSTDPNAPMLPEHSDTDTDFELAFEVLQRVLCSVEKAAPVSPFEHFTALLDEELRVLLPGANFEELDSTCRAAKLLKGVEPPAGTLLELIAKSYEILAKTNDGIGITPRVFNKFVTEMLQDAPAYIQLHLVAFLQREEDNLRFFVSFNELVMAVSVCLVLRKLLRDLESIFDKLCALDLSAQRLTMDAALEFIRTENWSTKDLSCSRGKLNPFATEAALQERLTALGQSCESAEDFDSMVENLVASQNADSGLMGLHNLCTREQHEVGALPLEQRIANAEKAIRVSATQNKGCIPLSDFQRVICLHLSPLTAITQVPTSPQTTSTY